MRFNANCARRRGSPRSSTIRPARPKSAAARKRGLYPDPQRRAFINKAVCEGCGDCSVASNCISIQPVETELGRKRRIDQSNCNKDFSCVEGFCPSFVTVHGGRPRRAAPVGGTGPDVADLPAPPFAELDRAYNILIAGVGGTGVITIGALIGMAAHLEGLGCTTLDFTGLSQKNGAVLSHVRLAPRPEDLAAVRIAPGAADLLIGCDLVVSASAASLSRLQPGTRAVVNSDALPTANFVINPDIDLEGGALRAALVDSVGENHLFAHRRDRNRGAPDGRRIGANAFLLGYAWQKGFRAAEAG